MDIDSIEKKLLMASEKRDYFEVVTILNVIRGLRDFDIASAVCDAVFLNTVFSLLPTYSNPLSFVMLHFSILTSTMSAVSYRIIGCLCITGYRLVATTLQTPLSLTVLSTGSRNSVKTAGEK